MGLPLRISDEIVLQARAEAEVSDRSLTGQIEHWVKLGMALEGVLGHRQAVALKRSGAAVPLSQALVQAESSEGQQRALEHLQATGQPRYGVDPTRPGSILRVNPDGTHTRGRFRQRVFIPDHEEPA
jgi:hypothetical protein